MMKECSRAMSQYIRRVHRSSYGFVVVDAATTLFIAPDVILLITREGAITCAQSFRILIYFAEYYEHIHTYKRKY